MSVWITALGSLLSAAQIGVNTAAVSAAPAASRSRDAPRFVAREQVRCRAAARFILEVHVDKFLIVSVFHDETGVRFFNDPWWRKAAGR